MFVINKCYLIGDGNKKYNCNSIVGVFDDFKIAQEQLLQKLNKLKYTFIDDELEYTNNYFFIEIETQNGKKISNGLCFEIMEKNFIINEIKIK
jgi:hypothetical protein